MLRGKIFEKNEEIRIGGQICPLPVCLGLRVAEITGSTDVECATLDLEEVGSNLGW